MSQQKQGQLTCISTSATERIRDKSLSSGNTRRKSRKLRLSLWMILQPQSLAPTLLVRF